MSKKINKRDEILEYPDARDDAVEFAALAQPQSYNIHVHIT